MQFLLLGYDGDDDGALDRRMAVREQHLAKGSEMVADGTLLFAAAMLDENDRMVGSAMIVDFPTRGDVDRYLETEPYVTGDVWRRIEITPCRVGPEFTKP